MRKILISLIIVLFTYGGTILSADANSVEVYYLKFRVPSECKKLGEVKAEAGSLMGQDMANTVAEDKLKQKAYDRYQANTLYISSAGSSFGAVNYQGHAEGIAYSCPK